jgi:phosphoenolpyruvate carboxykinase (ATP)
MIKELEKIGIKANKIIHNPTYDTIIKDTLNKGEVELTNSGATAVDTGEFTGRSPKDKYFVKQLPSDQYIAWGSINQPISLDTFKKLEKFTRVELSEKQELYVIDVFVGASKESRRGIRFVTPIAWQAHFVMNMFIIPSVEELENFKPDFTFLVAGKARFPEWNEVGLNSDIFVAFNIEENLAVMSGTMYGGEMKKGIFTMMNYWLPLEGKLSMHCSANVGEEGDVALFFGLSGTGKTTLSTDPKRKLIGDDEHGWDDKGVFNFEGGCYAKVINLDKDSEPEIYGAIRRGALLENVVIKDNGEVDYTDGSKTENTRVSYPIEHIENHECTLQGGHPKNIIFLSADAFGVLPPVSKLTKEQAMYYFLSGYTAKVAGTERGITEPVATFSACFGEPFLPLHPTVYAKLLGEKIDKHEVNVYLVNTGWTGGPYGVGHRMSIKDTRACINAILDGSIQNAEFETLPVFDLQIPKKLPGVNTEVRNPRNTWENKDAYDAQLKKLAEMFIENFKRYEDVPEGVEYEKAGPKI